MLGVDLYLSECVESIEGHVGYHRLMPRIVDPVDLNLDVIVATHFHRDHFDIDAIPLMMKNAYTRLYCSYDCQEDVNVLGIDSHRTIYVKPGNVFNEGGFDLTFIDCDHGAGAPKAVGVIIEVDNIRILVVGDTSLHLNWQEEYLKKGGLDVLIAPINGAYGNLSERDNIQLTSVLRPGLTVPCHFGMFSSHGGNPGLWKELLEQNLPGQSYKLFTMGEGIELRKQN